MVAIEFRDVYFRYNEDTPWVLKNFNLKIESKETVAILGHNGSGKSTIAKLANGLLMPQAGEIFIDDRKITPTNVWEIRQKIGMVFQNPENQFVGTTVRDDVAFGLENRAIAREEMLRRIQESLQQVGMEAYENHEPHHLSGGQKQRVAIASVMAIHPQVLLLDEATAMLDPRGKKEILATVLSLKEQLAITTVMITHDLQEISIADRVIVMNKGAIFKDTTTDKLFNSHQELQSIGLTIPLSVQLAIELEQYGYPFSTYPLKQEELIETLWKSHLKM
ncbi:energy-coupling factor transporter ATPase [Gracilibacillus alcaliphilus]|uniref:energy-coupling factor transporter ATPase n=1 Tax=Gracilibacillus alcaliphilus TaxID=1401441 RepID=UPI001959A979|nr:energy-coupling factor transporter ATPase [Gracilibacillus alcaliphilus]MBM7677370.1 energy-coupling factor transport system ATP-binding protein [Gracilibacillus alcaliphilus]